MVHMNRVIISLLKSRALQSVAKLMLGNAGGQVIGIIAVPILVREYSVEAFGTQAIFLSLTNILGGMASCGYHGAIILPKSYSQARDIWAIAVCLALLVSTLIIAILNACEMFVAWANLGLYIWLIPLSVTASIVMESNMAWLNRSRRYSFMSMMQMVVSIVNFITAYGYAKFFCDGGGLIYSAFVGNLLAGIVVIAYCSKDQYPLLTTYSLQRLWLQIKAYKSFPIFVLPSNILHYFCMQVPIFVLQTIGGEQVVGLFAMTNKILGMPINFIGNALSKVFIKELNDRWEKTGSVYTLYKRLVYVLATLNGVPFCIMYFLLPYIVILVLGGGWEKTAEYCRLLLPMYYFALFSGINNALILVTMNQSILPIAKTIRLVMVTGLMLLAYQTTADVDKVILAYSIAYCLYYAGSTILSLRIAAYNIKEEQ